MKYSIITPTFEPHFKFIEKYLESYAKFVVDKENITLTFTISKNEAALFEKITDRYSNDFKINTLFFENILSHFGINLSLDALLEKYGKFTFQTLKKFYTMLYCNADFFLILDSESMWIKKTKMKEVFDAFIDAPFISGSSVSNRKKISQFTQGVIDNVSYLLNKDSDKWFLENFVWFYDKKILNDLFKEYGSPVQLAESIFELKNPQKIDSGIFEIELYHTFLYHNLDKYGYKFINVDNLLAQTLAKEDLKTYLDHYDKLFGGNCGLLEHTMILLNESNYNLLSKMFKSNNFNIIRCNFTSFENISLQEKFLNIFHPNIFAASQEHSFGVNDKFKQLVREGKYLDKFEKHVFRLMHPTSFSLQLLLEPFAVVFYYFKAFLAIRRSKKKYNLLYKNRS